MNKVQVIPVIDIRRTWRNVTGRRLLRKFNDFRFFGFADRETNEIFVGLEDLYGASYGEFSFAAFLDEMNVTIDHEVAHIMDWDSGRGRRTEKLADAFEAAGRWARK